MTTHTILKFSPHALPATVKKTIPLMAALFVCVIIAYLPVFQNGYIWDDDLHITGNVLLQTGAGLKKIWLEPGAWPQYYPLTLTSFWLQYHQWGVNASGYHMVNVLLHAFSAFLIWRILWRLRVPGAALAAFVFALHPVHVETVAWASEHKNTLSTFFYLSAFLLYLRFSGLTVWSPDLSANTEAGAAPPAERSWLLYFSALLLFACALFSKTVTCSFPAAMLIVLWWKRPAFPWRELLLLAPFFILGAALGLTTVWMEKFVVGASGQTWDLTLADRCIIAGRALWFYAGKLLWPFNTTFIYPKWHIDAAQTGQYLYPFTAVLLLVVVWLNRARIGKGPAASLLIFGGTLFPALGFFDVYPMRYSYVADHFQYLASISLIALLAALFSTGWRNLPEPFRHPARISACAVLVLCLSLNVFHESHKYKNLETLWKDTIRKNPDAAIAHGNLGKILFYKGQAKAAMFHFNRALAIDPYLYETHNNLGGALFKQGDFEGALRHYRRALRLRTDLPHTHVNIGLIMIRQGKWDAAARHFRKALKIQPNFQPAQDALQRLQQQRNQEVTP